MNISLNIAGKIDPKIISLFETVNRVADKLTLPYVVVGATARDLVLHHGYGANVQRATEDVDFAIEVPNWSAFQLLKDKLCEQGFRTTKAQHRFISADDTVVDIVPFGQIEEEGSKISWPPNGEVIMNMLGFQEACDHADWIRIQENPDIDIPVATPAGMALLKIIAWLDRARDLRRKDALDLAYLLSSYEAIPIVTDLLYSDTQIMENYDWDLTQSAACLLGQHAANIVRSNTKKMISRLFNEGADGLNLERLTEEMCEHVDVQFEKNQRLISAFISGFSV